MSHVCWGPFSSLDQNLGASHQPQDAGAQMAFTRFVSRKASGRLLLPGSDSRMPWSWVIVEMALELTQIHEPQFRTAHWMSGSLPGSCAAVRESPERLQHSWQKALFWARLEQPLLFFCSVPLLSLGRFGAAQSVHPQSS